MTQSWRLKVSSRAAIVAVSFLLAAQVAGARELSPFASLTGSFWRSAKSDFGPDVAFMISPGGLSMTEPCFRLTHAFSGPEGRPHFLFRAEYWFLTTPDCTPRKSAFDAAASRLQETAAFHLDGNTLTLQDANDHEIASLTRIVPSGIEYRWWAITGYRRNGGIVRLLNPDGLKPNIAFFGGEVVGTPGAGSFDGTYSLDANHLKVSATMLCAGGCMGDIVERTQPQTDAIFRALESELTPKADGPRKFTLSNLDGEIQIELTEIRKSQQ